MTVYGVHRLIQFLIASTHLELAIFPCQRTTVEEMSSATTSIMKDGSIHITFNLYTLFRLSCLEIGASIEREDIIDLVRN